ncbi:MAG: TlpA family protein disulfide reductase, partial [Candidatus Kapaibacterium sp.]
GALGPLPCTGTRVSMTRLFNEIIPKFVVQQWRDVRVRAQCVHRASHGQVRHHYQDIKEFITEESMRLSAVFVVACTLALASSCSKSGNEKSEVFDLKQAAASAGQSMSSQVAPAAPETSAKFVVAASAVGAASSQRLIDITWKDADGNSRKLSEQAKGKIVVVNFWATWCPPCRREIPEFVEFAENNKDVYMVGVALERDDASAKDVVTRFANAQKMNYINVTSTSGFSTRSIAEAYSSIAPMDYIPVTIVFNAAGQQVDIIQGGTTKQGLADAVAKAR